MADKTMEISGRAVTVKYKDMGDGTHAEVISAEAPGGGAAPVAPSVPTVASATIAAAISLTGGATATAFASLACDALDVVNDTGVALEYRRDGAGNWLRIPDGSARLVIGITNANQVSVRRVDQASAAVTVTAEAFVA